MMTVSYKTDVLLPWPQGWEQMQWELAAWLAEHGDRAHVQVVWNETRLNTQVDVAEFKTITTDFYRVLQHRLGDGCQWQFEKREQSTGHRLVLGISAPKGA